MNRIRRHALVFLGLSIVLPSMAVPSFRRESKMPAQAIARQGYVELSPSSLVKAFGQPTDESWDSESLGGYYFVSAEGKAFAVYYRAYDLPAPAIKRLRKTFWSETPKYEFSIGAVSKEGVTEFVGWLRSQVGT